MPNSEPRPEISVVIPTTGRPTLERTLASIRLPCVEPPTDGIEIIVVGDIHADTYTPDLDAARRLCVRYGATYWEHDGGSHCWGQQQRNKGMSLATGRLITFLQDDDVYTAGAFDVIRRGEYSWPTLYRCYMHHGQRTVWHYRGKIEQGNVDANNIVVPNIPSKLGVWSSVYLGDLDFITETIRNFGSCTWNEHIIAEARPPA
jgi:hypothetical protein